MQNKKAFKILGFIALFLLIIFSWILVKDAQKKKIQNTTKNSGIENPFGGSTGENNLGTDKPTKKPTNSSTGNSTSQNGGSGDTNVVITEDNPAFRELSDKSVAGFTFVTEEREIPQTDTVPTDSSIVETFDFSGYKTIKFGDKADEIVAIKTVLNRQDPSPNLTIDNVYDTDMKNAVINFQNKSGLSGDGVIGGKTYAKLNLFQGIKTFSSTKKAIPTEKVLMARFVDSATGIVYDKAVRKTEDKVAKTTTSIPKVYEASFDSTGNAIVMRYLKDSNIETYVAKLIFPKIDPNMTKEEKDKIKKTADVTGEFLPEDVRTLAFTTDHKNMFFLNNAETGGSVGTTYNFATKAKKKIFTNPLSEWLSAYASDSKILLTTRASGEVSGYAYLLDVKSGALSKVLGGELGLTALPSPDGKKILYSEYKGGAVSTSIFDIAKSASYSVSPSTATDKCVWTKDSKKIYCAGPTRAKNFLYPDDWYKGKVSFEDALWVVDATNGSGNIVYDFMAKNKLSIDAINLTLDDNSNYISFVNKKDGTLWGFDLAR